MAEFEVVDAHQHVGSLVDALPDRGGAAPREPDVTEDSDHRVSAMDAYGIDWAVLQPSHGYATADGVKNTMAVNDRMARFKQYRPSRFRAVVGTVEPRHGDAVLAEIRRAGDELSLDGLSWHHRFQGAYLDCPIMWRIMERMAELDLTPMMHVNAESSLEAPWRLQRLARDFPSLTFVALDAFWSFERARHVLDVASSTPNVIWDCGGAVCYVDVGEWVRRNGATSLCFSAEVSYSGRAGSRHLAAMDRIQSADIDDGDRRLILGANIRRAFGLDGD